jgi:hypothetical protein
MSSVPFLGYGGDGAFFEGGVYELVAAIQGEEEITWGDGAGVDAPAVDHG